MLMSPMTPITAACSLHSPCKLFFLCEDWKALQEAFKLKNLLAQNCQGQAMMEAKFTLFARLCHPKLMQAAKKQVGEADLFIVAANSKALPLFVQQWINDFVPQKTRVGRSGCFEAFLTEPVFTLPGIEKQVEFDPGCINRPSFVQQPAQRSIRS
jgi:hypothetical protein